MGFKLPSFWTQKTRQQISKLEELSEIHQHSEPEQEWSRKLVSWLESTTTSYMHLNSPFPNNDRSSQKLAKLYVS